MKNKCLIFLIIISASIPIFLIWKLSLFCPFDTAAKIDLIKASLPLIFSLIILFITQIISNQKDEREKKRTKKAKANRHVESFNLIMIKSLKRYNSLSNELLYIESLKEDLSFIPEFKSFIDMWKSEIKDNMDYFHNKKFLNHINTKVHEIVLLYKKSNNYDEIFQYLSKVYLSLEEKEKLDNVDCIYIHNLRNLVSLSKQDNNLFSTYYLLYGDGSGNLRTINEFNNRVDRYNSVFNLKIRNKDITEAELHELLYGIFYKLFYLNEILCNEIFLLKDFLDALVLNFKKYYKEQKQIFSILNEYVDIETVESNVFVDNYRNKDILYNYYKI